MDIEIYNGDLTAHAQPKKPKGQWGQYIVVTGYGCDVSLKASAILLPDVDLVIEFIPILSGWTQRSQRKLTILFVIVYRANILLPIRLLTFFDFCYFRKDNSISTFQMELRKH